MHCEVCKAPVNHVKKRATTVKYIVTGLMAVATVLAFAEFNGLALSLSLLANYAWLWE
jgi:hypothetical protein